MLRLDDIGAMYGSREDQTGKLQEALDRAAKVKNGAVHVGGLIRSRPVDNSANVPIFGDGSGQDPDRSPSAILFDLEDPGGCAIKHSLNGLPYRIEGITLAGPGWLDPPPAGQAPARTSGILCPTSGKVHDVRVMGFRAAAESYNDHQLYSDFDFRSNGYAIDFVDNPNGGLGDMEFRHGYMNDQTLASIALSDSATLANARFTGNGHLGSAPFVVYRYTGQATPRRKTALVGVEFGWSLEAARHAVFYDEPGDGWWTDISFIAGGESGTFGGGPSWPGKPTDLAHFTVGYMDNWTMRTLPSQKDRNTIRARSIRNLNVASFRVDGMHDHHWRPLQVTGPYSEWGFECEAITLGVAGRYAGGTNASARVAHEDLVKGDLLEMAGVGHVQKARTRYPVGVSADDYMRGEVAVFCQQFDTPFLGVRNLTDTPIGRGKMFAPDPDHPGGVKATTSRPAAIGWAHQKPVPAGGYAPAMVCL